MCKAGRSVFADSDDQLMSGALSVQQMIEASNAQHLSHLRGNEWMNVAKKQKVRTLAHLLRRREGFFVVKLMYSGLSVAVDCKERKIYSWEWTPVSLDEFNLHRLDYGMRYSRFRVVYKL